MTALNPSTVDQDVDGTSWGERERTVEESLDRGNVGEVGFDRGMLLGRGLVGDGGESAECGVRGASVARSNGKDDGCTCFDKGNGTGLTDPTSSTSEEGRLAREGKETE